MNVSVVIPSLNSQVIGRTLDALSRQTYTQGPVEVLVIGLDERGLVSGREGVTFISTGQAASAAAARNLGLERAAGEVILFTDADCVPAPDWIARMVAHHARGEHAVGGAVGIASDNYWTLCDNVSMFHEFLPSWPASYRPYLPTLNLGVSRQAAAAVGPFDESFPQASAEDIDWTIRLRRAGYRLYFDPAIQVHHQPERTTLRRVLAHWHQAGRSMVRVRLRYADLYRTPWAVRRPAWLVGLSPLVAAYVTARIFLSDRALWRYLHTAPVVYLTKIAWCLGAARQVGEK